MKAVLEGRGFKPKFFDNRYEFDDGYSILDGQVVDPENPPIAFEVSQKLEAQDLKGFPLGKHEEIAWVLCRNFNREIERLRRDWLARPASIGVPTVGNKTRIPDVCVCEGDRWRKIRDPFAIVQDTPLLVVEIVSEGTRTIDYRYQLAEYQAVKIPEY